MLPDPTSHTELPDLTPEQIQIALKHGLAILPAEETSLDKILTQARRHPVLATAQATGLYQSALNNGEADLIARAELALGMCHMWWGYFPDAAAHLDAFFAAQIDDEQATLYARWHRLGCQRRMGRVADPTEQYFEIAQELAAIGDKTAHHRCLLDIAPTLALNHQPERANTILRAALNHFEQADLKTDYGLTRVIQARLAIHTKQLEQGFAWLAEAEEIFEQAGNPILLGYTWQQRGIYHIQKRQIEDAQCWLLAACQRAQAYRHPYYQVLALEDLANLWHWQGDNSKAFHTDQLIQRLARDHSLHSSLSNSMLRTGNYHFKRGQYDQANEAYRQAQQHYLAMELADYAAIAHMNQGVVAIQQGRFAAALEEIQQALDVFTAHADISNQALAHHNLGRAYAQFGYFEPAIEHLQTGIELTRQAGSPLQSAKTVVYLARLLLAQGDHEGAEALVTATQERVTDAGLDEDIALCDLVLGDILLEQGKPDAARQPYRASIARYEALEQPAAAADPMLGLAQTHLALQHSKAAERTLAQVNQKTLPAHLRWRQLLLKSQVMKQRDQRQSALASSLEALHEVRNARWNLRDEMHIQQFILALQPAFDEAFNLAMDLPDPERALVAVELYGSQLLNVRLGELSSGPQRDPTNLLKDLIQHLHVHLGSDWTVLRYLWHDNDLWLFVLTPEGLTYYAIPLLPQTRLALRTCASPDDSFRRYAFRQEDNDQYERGTDQRRRLFDVLLPQIVKNRLGPDHTLIIVPSYQLHGLAFNALLDGDQPLLTRSRIMIVQSLTQLIDLLEAPVHRSSLREGLLLGQTEFPFPDYPALPHITNEIYAIEQLQHSQLEMFSPQTTHAHDIIQRGESGEFARFDWLHVATHAFADRATGAFTGLLLGDGIISLGSIQHWQLNAQMVTLSACQSGLGRWYYGDEIAGLAQAFFRTGARTVVASLWCIQDNLTADLMTDFYAGLHEGQTPLMALTNAQRSAHADGLDPYYWAPFATFGVPV